MTAASMYLEDPNLHNVTYAEVVGDEEKHLWDCPEWLYLANARKALFCEY